jgi:hypothetical protein
MVKVLFGSSAIPKLWDRVFIFALIQFIVTKGMPVAEYNEIDNVQFLQWVRVISNLIYNTTIDSPELLLQGLKAIGQISKYCVDIYQKIADETNVVSFFDKLQLEEERRKSKLIINDKRWEILFDKYEQHSYFYGQVGFILELATTGGIANIDHFKLYAERASAVFSDDILMRNDHLLQRALLAEHEYVMEVNNNTYSLLLPDHGTLRLRRENWRQYFDHSGHKQYFKSFLDKIDPENVESCLTQIISLSDVDGWRKAIVDHSPIFGYCENGRLQWPNEIDNQDLVMVLGSTKRSGYHAELFSYCFRIDYASRFHLKFTPLKINYQFVKGSSEYPYAFIGAWEIGDLKIRAGIYYSGKIYQICVFDFDNQQLDTTTTEDLTNRGYILRDAYYQIEFANADDCYAELEFLCELFNKRTSSAVLESTVLSDTEI